MSHTSNSPALQEIRDRIDQQIAKFNEALKANDFAAMNAAETALKEEEKSYIETQAIIIYDECKKEKNPVLAAVLAYDFPVYMHRRVMDNGKVTGLEAISDRRRKVDLVKFCQHAQLSDVWKYKVEKFNELLCLRTAHDLKIPVEEITKISNTFFMNRLSREEKLGATPTSNTQVLKQLQMVLDAMVMVPREDGSNDLRAKSHDVEFLLKCYTKRGRSALSVAVAKHAFLNSLMLDIAHRIATNGVYGVEYKAEKEHAQSSEPANETPKKAVKKVSEPKAEKPKRVVKKSKPEPESAPAIEDDLPSVEELLGEATEEPAA